MSKSARAAVLGQGGLVTNIIVVDYEVFAVLELPAALLGRADWVVKSQTTKTAVVTVTSSAAISSGQVRLRAQSVSTT